MKSIKLLIIAFTIIIPSVCSAQSGYTLNAKISLPGNGGWDYMKIDEANHRLFISHGDRANVVDLKTNKEIAEIHNLQGAHHIILLPQFNKGFISNGNNNTVLVFNYKTLDSITTIKLNGENPDPVCYDNFSKKLFVFCDNNLAEIIDLATNKISGEIHLKGSPEFALPNGKGLIYNNLEDKDAIEIIDITKKQVIQSYPLKRGAAPTGMAADFKNERLFIACRGINELAVLNNKTGKIINSVPIGKKVDGVYFDEPNHLIICSGGDGTLTFIKQKNKNEYEVLQTLPTKPGAKTMVFDTNTKKIYVVASSSKSDHEIIPNSFEMLVYKK
ncbi:MAG: YncE family protein [Bacteroidota bacterium]|nr:YncE family protein [Bacteroidota bacterium]